MFGKRLLVKASIIKIMTLYDREGYVQLATRLTSPCGSISPFPCFPLSFVVLMFTFTLVVVQLIPQQQPLINLFSRLKEGGVNKPFVYDLCFSSTLGTSGVSL